MMYQVSEKKKFYILKCYIFFKERAKPPGLTLIAKNFIN